MKMGVTDDTKHSARAKLGIFLTVFVSLTGVAATGCGPATLSKNHQAPGQRANNANAIAPCSGTEAAPFLENLLAIGNGESTESRLWKGHSIPSHEGIVFVSGVDGGFIEPADTIYTRLGEKFSHVGVTSIFVRYRASGDLDTSVADALAGAQALREAGVTRMALVGWSFGGAVISHAAILIPETRTIIGFAPQALDTEPVARFNQQSILLIHSREDENVPFFASEQILEQAPEATKKQLIALDGYNHQLDGARAEIEPAVTKWIQSELAD